MKKLLTVILAAVMTLSVFAGCKSDPAGEKVESDSITATEAATTTLPVEEEKITVRIMTSNIWGDYSDNEVQGREDNLLEVYMKYMPDVLGVQEATYNWYQSALFSGLADAGYILLDDAPGMARNNYTPMFVKADRFNVVESGFEQLKRMNDQTKSIQWTVLEEKESGKKFVFCNTHFEWQSGAEYDAKRVRNAEQLAGLMESLKEEHGCEASFGFGDLNTKMESEVFTVFEEMSIQPLVNSAPEKRRVKSWHGEPERGEDGLFHGEASNRPFKFSIDHIVGTKGEYAVTAYEVVTDQPALDATDHSPVYADIEI